MRIPCAKPPPDPASLISQDIDHIADPDRQQAEPEKSASSVEGEPHEQDASEEEDRCKDRSKLAELAPMPHPIGVESPVIRFVVRDACPGDHWRWEDWRTGVALPTANPSVEFDRRAGAQINPS